MITNEQLHELIVKAIDRRAQSYTSHVTGKWISGQRTKFVTVTLSPGGMAAVIAGELVVPREVDGVEVRIGEAPARINKPSGRYMGSAMATGCDRPGAVGYPFLMEEAPSDDDVRS